MYLIKCNFLAFLENGTLFRFLDLSNPVFVLFFWNGIHAYNGIPEGE